MIVCAVPSAGAARARPWKEAGMAEGIIVDSITQPVSKDSTKPAGTMEH